MRKSPTKYTEEAKLHLLREYHASGMSKLQFARLHGIPCAYSINQWIKRYGTAAKSLSLPSEETQEDTMSNRSKDDYRQEIASQRRRIRELEKALAFSELETRARDMMIDRAEEYFDIQIRKKSGAK